MKKLFLFIICITVASFAQDKNKMQKEVQQYLNEYNKTYQVLLKDYNEAEWKLNTYIVEEDTLSSAAARVANENFAKFTGSKENIEKSTKYLKEKDKLTDLQVRQLNAILYAAGSFPQTIPDIVSARIKAEKLQVEKLFGYDFKVDGKSITANDIDEGLMNSTNVDERLKLWNSSKEVGKGLKDGLANLQQLRNKSVQALGYKDFFSYQVAEYGMSSEEMLKINQDMIKEIWPLYRELHTWARYYLAEKYKQEVPDMLPAQWLPNRWGQEWNGMIKVEGLDIDPVLKTKSAEWIVKEGEKFYISLGFDPLPQTFWKKSSLYPLSADSKIKKNNHASAWHIDNANDLRSLMSVEPNTAWWGTALHELGHIYYFMSYSNENVPIILRTGANRAYHEAIGSLIGLAAIQKPFLTNLGLLEKDSKSDEMLGLLNEALDYIVFTPFSAGVMTEFEYDLYANNLPKDQYNAKWWELVRKYQGIVPPSERGEEYCDAATKTHINDDAGQYYDYALSNLLLFQFHDYISKKILKQDPHATNYWGNKEIGEFLYNMMKPGMSVDWREHLRNTIGEDMSAKAMMDYFAPLYDYLKKVNEGRKYTLPEAI
ncbi:MAG TPA: M2 family metallopeptidase [Ignavibacteriaceae bacterium]|nr:M2 family metallopeptidase [Ignavibacteriaceae bacterium]